MYGLYRSTLNLTLFNKWNELECYVAKSCNLLVHANARPMVESLSPGVLVWKGKVLNMYYTCIRKAWDTPPQWVGTVERCVSSITTCKCEESTKQVWRKRETLPRSVDQAVAVIEYRSSLLCSLRCSWRCSLCCLWLCPWVFTWGTSWIFSYVFSWQFSLCFPWLFP